jgi:threonine/homoserine/homoserine lactone efflux protein
MADSPLWEKAIPLGATFLGIALVVRPEFVFFAFPAVDGRVMSWLRNRPEAAAWIFRATGVVLVYGALWFLADGSMLELLARPARHMWP